MIISVFPYDLRLFGVGEGLTLHGANLSNSAFLFRWINDERIDAVELFLPASLIAKREMLEAIANAYLPAHRRGRNVLRFYPIQFVPEVWSDGARRVIWCLDPPYFAKQRYLRDLYAVAPTPICSDVHSLAHQSMWRDLEPLVRVPPCLHDAIVSRAVDSKIAFEHAFEWMREVNEIAPTEELPCQLPVIVHAMDLETFRPASPEEKLELRQNLQLDPQKTIALYFGRIDPYSKGDILPLLESWHEVAGPNDQLVLAGGIEPESYKGILEEEIKERGLNVRFQGKIEPTERANYFRAADLFIIPADTIVDASPSTISEALCCGLPSIALDWTGTRDRIDEGIEGFLIPTVTPPIPARFAELSPVLGTMENCLMLNQMVAFDRKKMREALEVLLHDHNRCAEMSLAARARAERDFDNERISVQWFELFEELELIGQQESEDIREKRRQQARKLGSPFEYNEILGHYPSAVIGPNDSIGLSKIGRKTIINGETIFVFQDLSPLVRPEFLNLVLEVLMESESYMTTNIFKTFLLQKLKQSNSNFSIEWVDFVLGLLFKRGIIEWIPRC